MLCYAQGVVKRMRGQTVMLQLASMPLGFEITISHSVAASVGASIELYLYTHWVQDQGPALYGFSSADEREFFILIIGCPGVGPKLALALLEQASIAQLVSFIQSHDIKALSALKGIGSKKAEQLVLYLKDRLDQFLAQCSISPATAIPHTQQIAQVLDSLNYSRAEIQQAMAHIHGQPLESGAGFDTLLRKALAFLAKRP